MLQIIATVEDLGAISEDEERRQTIKLKNVALMGGDYCSGETRHILFLSPTQYEKLVSLLGSIKE